MRDHKPASSQGKATGGRWRRRVPFLAVAGLALAAAFLVGISDHPPGLLLVYVASMSFVLAFAHRWTRVRSFVVLLIASFVGFFVTALMHNLLYALNEWLQHPALWGPVLEVLHVLFFLAAIFLCPAGVLVGAVGAVITWWRTRRSDRGLASA